jgi:hypothetical protein
MNDNETPKNVGIGMSHMCDTTTGSKSGPFGTAAKYSKIEKCALNQDVTNNMMIGHNTGRLLTDASGNTFIGTNCCSKITKATNCLAIGDDIDFEEGSENLVIIKTENFQIKGTIPEGFAHQLHAALIGSTLTWNNDHIMKFYNKEDWGIKDGTELLGGFDERVYVDNDNNEITGVLEGFYGYASDTPYLNRQYVENGKRADTDFNYKGKF